MKVGSAHDTAWPRRVSTAEPADFVLKNSGEFEIGRTLFQGQKKKKEFFIKSKSEVH